MGGLLGGGGAKGMLAPLSNYWGGGLAPPLPTPMSLTVGRVVWDSTVYDRKFASRIWPGKISVFEWRHVLPLFFTLRLVSPQEDSIIIS